MGINDILDQLRKSHEPLFFKEDSLNFKGNILKKRLQLINQVPYIIKIHENQKKPNDF
jgi:hypothetical protein